MMSSRFKISFRPWSRNRRRILGPILAFAAAQLFTPLAYAQLVGVPPIALKPVDLKVLVLTGDGAEPSFKSIQSFLNQIGIPHNDVILAPATGAAIPLPALNDANKGFYQAIILATGNLVACDAKGVCASALSDAGWAALDTYAATFGIRTLSYYTYPNPRYGLSYVSALNTATTPTALTFAAAASTIFPYLNLTHPVTVTYSYAYLAAPVAALGESTTPILSLGTGTVGVLHKKPDGREYLALTFDNNPSLLHSLSLGYGLINWVTKGVFLGSRQVYSTPQVDDLFLANELYDSVTPGCKPVGFLIDPTSDLTSQCPTGKVSGADLLSLSAWQDKLQASPQTSNFQVTMGFNGVGAADPDTVIATGDDLVSAVLAINKKFVWVSHTYDHMNLDCFNPVAKSGICTLANGAESGAEIDHNLLIAKALGLSVDAGSMITPEISGLTNAEFVQVAVTRGIKYLIIDSSTLALNPPPHNTGIRNALNPSILMVPRRPTSIFYNTVSPNPGAVGSLPDEYNYFYGPHGLFRIGGPNGTPFYGTNQTYAQIINSESDSLLMDMLRFKADPIMFHQSNLARYDHANSLFTDVMAETLKKFTDMSNLPVTSLPESAIGQLYQERMDYNASGVQATFRPGTPPTITLTTTKSATIPVTGACTNIATCATYGGQTIQKVLVPAGTTVTL